MPHQKLKDALLSVDWNANVAQFLQDTSAASDIGQGSLKLALWAKQFEICDKGNPALSFVREMQSSGFHVAALISLALYKPAAVAMRTIVETSLYYTYFRTHPCELVTLIRNPKFRMDKAILIEFHNEHTPEFKTLQSKLGLVGDLNDWYYKISAIIHGQIPGCWIEQRSLAEIRHAPSTLKVVIESFSQAVRIVHNMFLCTVGREMWKDFSSPVKGKLLAGLSGEIKTALGLDSA